jgi:hypothetical protein
VTDVGVVQAQGKDVESRIAIDTTGRKYIRLDLFVIVIFVLAVI